jgi:outer membrane protein
MRIAILISVLLSSAAAAAQPAPDRPTMTLRADKAVAPLRHEIESESPDLATRLDGMLTLDDCIQIALERNIPLAIARQSRAAAHVQADGAIGEFLPEIQLSGGRTRIERLTAREYIDDAEAKIVQRLPIGTLVEAGVRLNDSSADTEERAGIPAVIVTQPLLRNAGWTAATGALQDRRYSARVRDAALRSQTLSVVFNVTSAYLDLERRRQLVDVNERAVARDDELLAFSQAKLEAQLATQRDVLSAEIIQAQDRGRLVNAQASYQGALDNLTNILGLRVTRELQIEPLEMVVDSVALDEEAWVAKALRDNPLIEQAKLECERADLVKRLAGNGRLPQLDLSVSYDQLRVPVSNDPVERTWSGQVAVSYPLLNKQLGSDYTAARLAYDQSRRIVVDTERQVVLSVRDAVRNLQRGLERIEILRKNIQGAQAKVEFAKVNFQLGRASNLDITDAQKDLLDAETDHVNELVVYRQELARLEQLLGGSIRE